jgi:adenine-specific DNA-methyltransferase
LRICEDRNIESYEKLKKAVTQKHVYSKLLDIFQEADAKYNSGLFDFSSDYLTKTLTIDDFVLKQIILNLYYPISPYDFSILSVELLGNVYEKFLGKTIRLTSSHKAKIEEKPEVRQAGGVYYTPEFIVEYIVKNTLGKLIEDKTPQDIEKIRILDSACGSGTFLVRAYSYLLDFHQNYYSKNPKKYKKEIYQFKEKQWLLTTEVRKKILLNNIFGLEIDPQAAEITKLSLLLKVLENETKETVNQQLKLFQEKALPDLGKNIKCGNSLVDSSFFLYKQVEQLSSEELTKINPFDWTDKITGFGNILVEGGFDIIVGNPPYVKEDVNREIFEFVKKTNMEKYYQGKMDYWYFFTCKALDLLKDKGLHSFIAQNNWITSYGAKILRNKILKESKIISFYDFNEFKVFEDADIQTMIFVIKKMKKIPKNYTVDYHKIRDSNIPIEQLRNNLLYRENSDRIESFFPEITPMNLINKTITFADSDVSAILNKISEKSNRKLKKDEIGNGIDVLQDCVSEKHLKKLKDPTISKGDGIFVLNSKEKLKIKFNKKELKKIKPFFTPDKLKKHFANLNNDYWIIYADKEVRTNIDNFPNIRKHLDRFRVVLTSVYKPYGLHRPREQELFEGEKILALRKTKKPSFTYTDFSCYVARSFLIIKPKNIHLKFLTGLLNSKLAYFVFYFDGKKQGEQLQIDKDPLLNFPIKLPKNLAEKKILENIIHLVTSIMETKNEIYKIRLEQEKNILLQKIQSLENQIDESIFQLYEFTKDEIRIIDSSLKKLM